MKCGYSDLHDFWTCPRLLGFRRLGYRPASHSEPITTGLLTHTSIFAYFRDQDEMKGIITQANQIKRENPEAAEELVKATLRAINLTRRYIATGAKEYRVLMVEPEITVGNVICHPDLVVMFHDQLTILDIKTGKQPDYRWYDISGQCDLYAVIYEARYHKPIQMVAYDVISEEGIFRHQRPLRRSQGESLARACNKLAEWSIDQLLMEYHPEFDCPNRCSYFEACWLLTTGSKKAATSWLEGNMIAGGRT